MGMGTVCRLRASGPSSAISASTERAPAGVDSALAGGNDVAPADGGVVGASHGGGVAGGMLEGRVGPSGCTVGAPVGTVPPVRQPEKRAGPPVETCGDACGETCGPPVVTMVPRSAPVGP